MQFNEGVTMNGLRQLMRLVIFAGMINLLIAGASAQGYPAKPIRVIIPYPPGGGNDIVVRSIGQKLAERLGQSVLVENKPGGGTLIGAEAAAKSAPDGYSLFLGTIATMSINPSLYRTLPYDPVKDFAPITQLVNYSMFLVVNPSVPANSVAELLALAKTRQLSYASFGNGSTSHLGMELLKAMTGVQLLHVPYKGSLPALTDVMGGQVPVMFVDLPPSLSQIKSGRVRALGVSSLRRSTLMPEVPAVAETVPSFSYASWAGLFAPTATPAAIIARLHDEIVHVLNQPDIKAQLSGLGAEPVGSTPQEFAALIRSEIAKWAKVVKVSGAKLD